VTGHQISPINLVLDALSSINTVTKSFLRSSITLSPF